MKSGSFGEKKGGDKDYSGQSQSYEEKWQHNAQDLEKDMNKLNVNDGGGFKNRQATGGRQGSMPPRLQGENKKSKRYSSIRQRSLPETANPPVQLQHSNFYSNGLFSFVFCLYLSFVFYFSFIFIFLLYFLILYILFFSLHFSSICLKNFYFLF